MRGGGLCIPRPLCLPCWPLCPPARSPAGLSRAGASWTPSHPSRTHSFPWESPGATVSLSGRVCRLHHRLSWGAAGSVAESPSLMSPAAPWAPPGVASQGLCPWLLLPPWALAQPRAAGLLAPGGRLRVPEKGVCTAATGRAQPGSGHLAPAEAEQVVGAAYTVGAELRGPGLLLGVPTTDTERGSWPHLPTSPWSGRPCAEPLCTRAIAFTVTALHAV